MIVGSLSSGSSGPRPEEFVEHVADELLALGLVQRLVLLGKLLGDDVADFGLDLLARHLFERLQVDEVDQPLVKLDLELGMLVALRERAGIADCDKPVLVHSRAVALPPDRPRSGPAYGSATCSPLQPQRRRDPGIKKVQVLADAPSCA